MTSSPAGEIFLTRLHPNERLSPISNWARVLAAFSANVSCSAIGLTMGLRTPRLILEKLLNSTLGD